MFVTPFKIDSPGIFAISILVAVLNHLYPDHIAVPLETFLATNAKARASFEIDFQMSQRLTKDADRLITTIHAEQDSGTNDPGIIGQLQAKLESLHHHITDQDKTLSRYPNIYFKHFGHQHKVIATRPVMPMMQRIEPIQYRYMAGRIPHQVAEFITYILPSVILFLVYVFILLTCGWNYSIFSIKTHPVSSPPSLLLAETISESGSVDGIAPPQPSTGLIIGLYWWIFGVVKWFVLIIPKMMINTIHSTVSSFFGLYYLIYQLIAHLIPEKIFKIEDGTDFDNNNNDNDNDNDHAENNGDDEEDDDTSKGMSEVDEDRKTK